MTVPILILANMSKLNDEDNQINEIKEIGLKNKKLIPHIQNWCKNIVLECYAAGMVAKLYNFPNNIQISCPNAGSSNGGMNFEWIAGDFIIKNCRNCKHHEEVFKKNFGNEIISEYLENESLKKKKQTEETQKKESLKNEIEKLIKKEKNKGEITKLSILKLIQLLYENENNKNISEKILEASTLSPKYFNELALDYLSIFYNNNEYGVKLLEATNNVLNSGVKLSEFAFQRLLSTIEDNSNLDILVGILRNEIKTRNFEDYYSLIDHIIDLLWYKRNIGDAYDDRRKYPNSVKLLIDLYNYSVETFNERIKEHLKVNDKTKRININFLLHELIEVDHNIATPHLFTIIQSLELDDDAYEESADRTTCATIGKIFQKEPELVLNETNSGFKKLNLGAQVEIIGLYEKLIIENDFEGYGEIERNCLIERVFSILFSKNIKSELKEKAIKTVEYISKEKPKFITIKLNSIIGLLIKSIKDYEAFLFYMKELEKPRNQISTFNPLVGLSHIDIINLEQKNENEIRNIKYIIENIVKSDNESTYLQIITVLNNLKSDKDEKLKWYLIEIIRHSIVSPLYLAELLPTIYSYLLDINSKVIRYEGISFLVYLIDNHDNLVTQTFIDIIKVFMKDSDVGIKGKAFEAFGSLTKKFPKYIEKEQINLILSSLTDRFIFIHETVAKLAYKIFPFLSENQKKILLYGILNLENIYYKEKNFEFCMKLVDIVLFITKEQPKVYSWIVKTYVPKYCNTGSVYSEIDFLNKLTNIRDLSSEFNEVWFDVVIKYLSKTKPDLRSNTYESRLNFYDTFFSLPQSIIIKNIDEITALVKDKIKLNAFYDVNNILFVLAYFNLHEKIVELSEYFKLVIENNKSNEYGHKNIEIFLRVSKVEAMVASKKINTAFIKSQK